MMMLQSPGRPPARGPAGSHGGLLRQRHLDPPPRRLAVQRAHGQSIGAAWEKNISLNLHANYQRNCFVQIGLESSLEKESKIRFNRNFLPANLEKLDRAGFSLCPCDLRNQEKKKIYGIVSLFSTAFSELVFGADLGECAWFRNNQHRHRGHHSPHKISELDRSPV